MSQQHLDPLCLAFLYAPPMELNEWVRAARKHANLTQEQMAERLNMTKGNISGWENGRHAPSFDQVMKISELTGMAVEGIPIRGEEESVAPAQTRTGRLVPVVGTAKMGEDGFYEEISSVTGAGDGHINIASEDPNAYGLRVRGQSMFPAIRDGWFVLVEPNLPPREGEYVLLKLRDGQRMVKEFMYRRSGSIEVLSVNGGERLSFELAELDDHRGIQAVGAVLPASKWRPD